MRPRRAAVRVSSCYSRPLSNSARVCISIYSCAMWSESQILGSKAFKVSRMMKGKGIFFTTTLLLGLPGLLIFLWGLAAALVSFAPGAEVDIAGSDKPIAGFIAGIVAIAAGSLLLKAPSWIRGRMYPEG